MRVGEGKAGTRRRAVGVGALALALFVGGCASTDRLFGGQSSSASASSSGSQSASSTFSSIRDVILQKPAQPTEAEKQAAVTNIAENVCPPLDVRTGAGTLIIPPGNAEAFSLRYQGSIGDMARECKVSGGIMHMKVGIEGRVLVGPAGGPGQIDIPVRYAVVKEGPEPKTVVSKFSKVPVTIPEGQQNVLFSHVDNDLAFPMPPGLDIESYVVYIGFDPLAEKQAPAKKPQAKPVRR